MSKESRQAYMLRKKQAELEKQQQLSQEIEQKLAAANNRLKETEERYAALKKQEEFLQCMLRYRENNHLLKL